MSFKTSCPHCGQKYELENDQIGQIVICEVCNKPFTVTETAAKQFVDNRQITNCSACGGIVHFDAAVCPHCGKVRKSTASVSVSGILQVLLLFFGFPLAVAVSGAAGGNTPVIVAIWCATLIIVLRR